MALSISPELHRSGLFCHFDNAAKTRISQMMTQRSFAHGEIIYRIGDEPSALFGVVSGAIKLFGEDRNGKQCLFGITPPGYWFGDSSALDGKPRAQTSIAAGDTSVIMLSRQGLLALLSERPELYQPFVTVLCLRLRQAGRLLEEAATLPVATRLAKQLIRLHKVRSQHAIKLSQEDLAASIGVTRQSISRVLKHWQQQQWITLNYGNVVVNQLSALKRLLEASSYIPAKDQ